MKGLEVAESFFREWGLPYLTREHPGIVARMAAGRIFGSDVLGADDEISRDHNWGPQFFLFLSEGDFAEHGARLEQELNAAAPNPWRGFRLAGAEDQSVCVVSIPQWLRSRFGLSQVPSNLAAWTGLDESDLYFLKHGAIWMDGTGEFTTWRAALSCYPEPIRLTRLAEECFRVWHHGEYNFVQRMARRQDPLSIALCLGQFVDGVMRMTLLLNSDYSPYWKWLAYEFRKQQMATELAPLMEVLLASGDVPQQIALVNEICARIRERLLKRGVITGAGDKPYLLPLLNARDELQERAKRAQQMYEHRGVD
jgi:hypothetical protein